MRISCKSLLLFALAPTMQVMALQGAEPADLVIRAKYVLTMDAQHHLYSPGAVAIRGTQIAGVGTSSDIASRFEAKSVLDKPDAVLAPGLIDTHTHAPMSLFRAIADDRRLEDWLTNFIFPAESKTVNPEFVRWGTRLACLEMVLAGITTYTDMYYFEDVEAETAKEVGVRGVLGQTIIGFPSPDHKNWREALAGAEQYIQRFQKDELITPAVAPHAIYTTPNEILVAAHQLARKYQVPLIIHLSETEKEYKDALSQRGQTPTQVLDRLGVLNGRVVAAHCVWESDDDLRLLKQHGTGVAHCPSSNMKLASGVARIQEMLRLRLTVGLGTDGFAGSNDSADLIREMDLAAKLQKVITRDPTALTAEQALEMATMGGARVLGLEKKIGSLEMGKQADVIAINLARPNAAPMYNLYSQLAYATKAADVEDVFINGRQIVKDRRVLTLDTAAVLAQAEQYRTRILAAIRNGSR
jgi:5-methylthioadenosine/S-adenosylhomocysteine deaminase